MKKYTFFQLVVTFTFIIFFSLLGMAVVVAYGRTSGNTGLDMATMQQLRAGVRDIK